MKTGIAELDEELDKLDRAIDRSNAEKYAMRAALKALLEHLPELWGDLVKSGEIVLRINADAVEDALAAIAKAEGR